MREIFFLDDSKDEALLTSIYLREADNDVRCRFFLRYEELLEALVQRYSQRNALPDLIAVDLSMPTINGREVVVALKGDKRFVGLPIGVCTGSIDPNEKNRSLACGADFFVVKPFDAIKLQSALAQVSENRSQSTNSCTLSENSV